MTLSTDDGKWLFEWFSLEFDTGLVRVWGTRNVFEWFLFEFGIRVLLTSGCSLDTCCVFGFVWSVSVCNCSIFCGYDFACFSVVLWLQWSSRTIYCNMLLYFQFQCRIVRWNKDMKIILTKEMMDCCSIQTGRKYFLVKSICFNKFPCTLVKFISLDDYIEVAFKEKACNWNPTASRPTTFV